MLMTVAAVASALSLYYLAAVLFLYRGLKKIEPAGPQNNLTYSIVIAARNEEQNIIPCLETVFGQEMAPERFEVIVVNDRSVDRTASLCVEYARNHARMSLITVVKTPDGVAPKKHAVMEGIKRSTNQIVVLTDADCRVGPQWLATIDRYFTEQTGLVQGITAYGEKSGMNRLFRGLQAIDFLSHGIVAAAAIGAGMPLNSNANNFAFRRAAFEDAGGYGGASRKVVSGDDDLLLQRIARKGRWRVRFMTDPAGSVVTMPTTTLQGVFEQRKRWGSKTVRYAPGQALFLAGIFMFYCVIIAMFTAGFFQPRLFLIFFALLAIKLAGEYLLLIPGTALFRQKPLRPYILPASLVQVPLVILATIFGVFGRFSWKGERFSREVAAKPETKKAAHGSLDKLGTSSRETMKKQGYDC
ncbi:MAG: glycosyltransferase [Chitinispirillaceae bacterium]|nr:glycosyltransferase [Chitinispirillaceae bacterium]